VIATLRAALEGTGLNLLGTAPIALYDAIAPAALRSAVLAPGSRGLVVIGSAGRALWSAFRRHAEQHPGHDALPHPLDAYVETALDRGDAALAAAGISARRFLPTLDARPALDFRALGRLVGFGVEGPFGLLVHETHGPWIALRGAWMIDVDVPAPVPPPSPCAGCAAPCVGGREARVTIGHSTREMRLRCIVGVESRYEDAQIAFHYDKVETHT
jgi:hypothetical protein